MLVLTRKEKQSFLIGDNIEITLLEVSGDKAKIAINAPREVSILRKELAEAKQTNIEAATSFDPAKLPKLMPSGKAGAASGKTPGGVKPVPVVGKVKPESGGDQEPAGNAGSETKAEPEKPKSSGETELG